MPRSLETRHVRCFRTVAFPCPVLIPQTGAMSGSAPPRRAATRSIRPLLLELQDGGDRPEGNGVGQAGDDAAEDAADRRLEGGDAGELERLRPLLDLRRQL